MTESPRTRMAEDHVDLQAGGRLLCRYVYRSDAPATESARPYLHPLRTLAGETVTGFRPDDHPWHHGLSFTSANLSGQNFWGGRTYV
ncbi:MAG: PmoA family protein, partial [Candidatus Dormibacteraeota bacterium]|nr:PmoA family protein [Candidatus Dormibacteraeota bacterium]